MLGKCNLFATGSSVLLTQGSALPARASDVKDLMQQFSGLPSAVEERITTQFNKITEQILRDQHLRTTPSIQQGEPSISALTQRIEVVRKTQRSTITGFSKRKTTSFAASMRSLPGLPKKKRGRCRRVQKEAMADQASANDCDSMIGGASTVDLALHDQKSIHSNSCGKDLSCNSVLRGDDDAPTSNLTIHPLSPTMDDNQSDFFAPDDQDTLPKEVQEKTRHASIQMILK